MSVAGDLSTHLHGQSTQFTIAGSTGNVFTNSLPETTKLALAIFETGGLSPQHTFASEMPAIERPRIQLIARSTPPDESSPASSTGVRAFIDEAFTILEKVSNQAIAGTTYLLVRSVQPPAVLEVDEAGRVLFFQNYDVMRRKTTSNE